MVEQQRDTVRKLEVSSDRIANARSHSSAA
jgi:hypothetical protein